MTRTKNGKPTGDFSTRDHELNHRCVFITDVKGEGQGGSKVQCTLPVTTAKIMEIPPYGMHKFGRVCKIGTGGKDYSNKKR